MALKTDPIKSLDIYSAIFGTSSTASSGLTSEEEKAKKAAESSASGAFYIPPLGTVAVVPEEKANADISIALAAVTQASQQNLSAHDDPPQEEGVQEMLPNEEISLNRLEAQQLQQITLSRVLLDSWISKLLKPLAAWGTKLNKDRTDNTRLDKPLFDSALGMELAPILGQVPEKLASVVQEKGGVYMMVPFEGTAFETHFRPILPFLSLKQVISNLDLPPVPVKEQAYPPSRIETTVVITRGAPSQVFVYVNPEAPAKNVVTLTSLPPLPSEEPGDHRVIARVSLSGDSDLKEFQVVSKFPEAFNNEAVVEDLVKMLVVVHHQHLQNFAGVIMQPRMTTSPHQKVTRILGPQGAEAGENRQGKSSYTSYGRVSEMSEYNGF